MSAGPPPWCLHWDSDGELTGSDRQDLFSSLMVDECDTAQAQRKLWRGLAENQRLVVPAGIPDRPQQRAQL